MLLSRGRGCFKVLLLPSLSFYSSPWDYDLCPPSSTFEGPPHLLRVTHPLPQLPNSVLSRPILHTSQFVQSCVWLPVFLKLMFQCWKPMRHCFDSLTMRIRLFRDWSIGVCNGQIRYVIAPCGDKCPRFGMFLFPKYWAHCVLLFFLNVNFFGVHFARGKNLCSINESVYWILKDMSFPVIYFLMNLYYHTLAKN